MKIQLKFYVSYSITSKGNDYCFFGKRKPVTAIQRNFFVFFPEKRKLLQIPH